MPLAFPKVAVVGGAGYVGSALVPRLLDAGYEVTVLDLFLFHPTLFADLAGRPGLRLVRADICDEAAVRSALAGQDAVIHLACISNDPGFELDPALGKAINFDAFPPLVRAARDGGARRFVYASSSSVYGVREEPEVTEDTPCTPLTDYSKFKLECEHHLHRNPPAGMDWVILRPATGCGFAPRLRLDLTVNILTIHALVNRKILVFGGSQKRPNLHVDDMADVYLRLLDAPRSQVHGRTFNAGYQNHPVAEIAEIVRRTVGDPAITIETRPTNDLRSYHINSDRIGRELGYVPRRGIDDAVRGLCDAFAAGRIPEPMTRESYHNVRVLKRWYEERGKAKA